MRRLDQSLLERPGDRSGKDSYDSGPLSMRIRVEMFHERCHAWDRLADKVQRHLLQIGHSRFLALSREARHQVLHRRVPSKTVWGRAHGEAKHSPCKCLLVKPEKLGDVLHNGVLRGLHMDTAEQAVAHGEHHDRRIRVSCKVLRHSKYGHRAELQSGDVNQAPRRHGGETRLVEKSASSRRQEIEALCCSDAIHPKLEPGAEGILCVRRHAFTDRSCPSYGLALKHVLERELCEKIG